MSNIAPIAPTGVQPNRQNSGASANNSKSSSSRDEKAPATQAASAKAGAINAQVTYSAGLEAIRSANKLMMGYLLNVTV
jgi:hypothetical protein